jgi:glycosyltransferase involved in cell wall biosynthesis
MGPMMRLARTMGALKGRIVRSAAVALAWALRRMPHPGFEPGTTVVTVNWNSLPFLRVMLDAVRAMSPPETKILVIDNGSNDGSVAYLRTRNDVRVVRLPLNVGHGVGLDIALALVRTEYVAVLDIDAFPISHQWLLQSTAALEDGAQVAGAHMHRNFIHPCFLVVRSRLVRDYGLTFRPVGSLRSGSTRAPLFLDVGEALSQRVIVKFGGGQALHPFEITSTRGPGVDGAVFGNLVYHNMFATQGTGRKQAVDHWREAVGFFHPNLLDQISDVPG